MRHFLGPAASYNTWCASLVVECIHLKEPKLSFVWIFSLKLWNSCVMEGEWAGCRFFLLQQLIWLIITNFIQRGEINQWNQQILILCVSEGLRCESQGLLPERTEEVRLMAFAHHSTDCTDGGAHSCPHRIENLFLKTGHLHGNLIQEKHGTWLFVFWD